jgi:hypothetical protein
MATRAGQSVHHAASGTTHFWRVERQARLQSQVVRIDADGVCHADDYAIEALEDGAQWRHFRFANATPNHLEIRRGSDGRNFIEPSGV